MSQPFAYNAPTDLTGAYDPATGSVPLTWVAPTLNNLTTFAETGEYLIPQGYTNFTFTLLGPGGGGAGGDAGYGQASLIVGGGGGGGAYAQTTLPLSAFDSLTVLPVTVGTGGAGGISQSESYPPGGAVGASNGSPGSFATAVNGNWIVAGAGGAGLGGSMQSGGAGGTASVLSGLGAFNTTTEAGGAGGSGSGSSNSDTQRNGASTTNAGPGGAGGGTFSIPGGSGGVGPGLAQSGGATANFLGGVGVVATFPTNGATSNDAAPQTGLAQSASTFGEAGGGGAGGVASLTNSDAGHNATASAGSNGGVWGAGGGGGGSACAGGIGNNFACTAVGGLGGSGAPGSMTILASNLSLPLTGYVILRNGLPIGTSATAAFTDPDPIFGTNCYTVEAVSGSTVVSPLSNQDCIEFGIQLTGQPAGTAGTDILLTWTPFNGADTEFEVFQVGVSEAIATVAAPTLGFVVSHLVPATTYQFRVVGNVNGPSNEVTVTTGDTGLQTFNCDCSLEPTQQTLAELRTRVMVRLGYPNQAANPPPGMTALVNAFLYDAQKLIWKQLSRAGLNVERFFRWVMVPGQRYYGIDANADNCDLQLDPYKVVWAGFEDLNQAWYRLTEGVPPEYYTRANINFGWPTHYEIRGCIEIFPAPQAPYTLWIKGDFGLASFTNDDDTATIDDQAVFMLALGTAKQHYGQQDGAAVLAQADTYIRGLVAGLHGTRRYVPRTKVQNPATPPRFLPLGDAQA